MKWIQWLLLVLMFLGVIPLSGCAAKGGFEIGIPPEQIVVVDYDVEAFVGDSAPDTVNARVKAKFPWVGPLLESLDALDLFGKPDTP